MGLNIFLQELNCNHYQELSTKEKPV